MILKLQRKTQTQLWLPKSTFTLGLTTGRSGARWPNVQTGDSSLTATLCLWPGREIGSDDRATDRWHRKFPMLRKNISEWRNEHPAAAPEVLMPWAPETPRQQTGTWCRTAASQLQPHSFPQLQFRVRSSASVLKVIKVWSKPFVSQ